MLINFGLWQDTGLFGDFGGDGRGFTNPGFGIFFTPFGQTIEGLPNWPMFEVIVATILIFGAIYYAPRSPGPGPRRRGRTRPPARRSSADHRASQPGGRRVGLPAHRPSHGPADGAAETRRAVPIPASCGRLE